MAAADTDPTLELIASLDDPAKWRTITRAAIFRAHVRRGDDGEEVYAVTDSDLATIARNTNRAYSEAGQPVRLTIGHSRIDPDADERTQPVLYGFAVGYKAERVRRPDGDYLAVTQTEKVRPEFYEALKNYPFRSVEYNPQTKTITGCAALLRTPFLKLGAVYTYHAGTSPTYRYSLGVSAVSDPATPADDKKKEDEFYSMLKTCMKRYEAEMAGGDDPTKKNDQADTEVSNQGTSKEIAYALAEVAKVKAAQADTQVALTRERTARLLDPLKSVVSFDETTEVAYMASLPSDKARADRVTYMLTHYAKLPTGQMIGVVIPPAGPTSGGEAPLTREEMYQAQSYRQEKGVGVAESHAHVKGLRKK